MTKTMVGNPPISVAKAGGLSPRRRAYEIGMRTLIYLASGLVVALLIFLLGYIFYKGIPNLTWEFLTSEESVLKGVDPSILYALVGSLIFCQTLGLGKTLIAGSMTLVIMTLPTIIRTTQESLKTVPQSYREGSLGLGAGKWHMIRTVVLPSSVDGIVTGCILAIGRIVGESAVLLYTVGMSMSMQEYFRDGLSSLLQSSGSTLTVALYVYAKERADFDLAFSVAVVLLAITLVINLAAKLVGKGLRKK